MQLPYFDNPCAARDRLAPLGEAMLLDSGGSERGDWDVIAAAPASSLLLPASADRAAIDAFIARVLALEAALPERRADDAPRPPFCGGIAGFLSYELGRRLHGLPPAPGARQPLAQVRLYPWAVVQNRRTRESTLVSQAPLCAAERRHIAALLEGPAPAGDTTFALTGAFSAVWSLADYKQRFAAVQRYIGSGDCYQINLGQPYTAPCSGSLATAYNTLRTAARAPFSAFWPLAENAALLCLSPERFISVRNGRVHTHPIKGTRPRHPEPHRDRELAAQLLASPKERAENLMIVDLLRNDIGRYCDPGTVRVEKLFAIESYATVHHLVSHVSGGLRGDTSPLELLLGCLPGGSITGAPKHRAMQIIDELEAAPRESWCGTVFARCASGSLDSNILIRTLHGDGATVTCWAGGGLVADSAVADEFQELQDKVGGLLRALGDAH